MVRKYAHLSTAYRVGYVDRLSNIKLAERKEAATIQLQLHQLKRAYISVSP